MNPRFNSREAAGATGRYAAAVAQGGMEREFKLELGDARAVARLRAALGPAPERSARQENHFFDTPAGDLRGARLALRLRDEEGRWFLTLKGPRQQAAGALSARAEEELELEADAARALLARDGDPLAWFEGRPDGAVELVRTARAALRGAALARLGSFTNERTRLGPLALGAGLPALVLELDRSRFPDGQEAFELEVELPADAQAPAVEGALRALFARLDLPWRAGENKAARFFRALDARAGR